jgi:hypothetical protein
MAFIQYLRLDTSNDPILIPDVSLTDINAVAQAILTRLKLFQAEWWEDLNEGTPMFQSILGASGSPKNQQAMTLALIERISGTPYVSGLQDISSRFDSRTRKFSFSATAQTAFGPVPVSFTPGVGAGLGV